VTPCPRCCIYLADLLRDRAILCRQVGDHKVSAAFIGVAVELEAKADASDRDTTPTMRVEVCAACSGKIR